MPHTARARPASLVRGPGSQQPQLKKLLSPHVKQRVKKRTRPACSLITTPLLTELVKLTLSTSSVTNTNTIAAGTLAHQFQVSTMRLASHPLLPRLYVPAVSQAVGPNYLVWYSILCALTASVGTWVVHLISYLWHNLFEGYVVQERSTQQKVLLSFNFLLSAAAYNHSLTHQPMHMGALANACLKGFCWI